MSEYDHLWVTIENALNEGWDLDSLEKELWERFGDTRAVMMLDSTGFSRATQESGIVFYLTLISRLRKIGREVFAESSVFRWREEADNLYASFPTPDEAVFAAFAIHRRLEEENIQLPGGATFGASIGIGYGRMLRSDTEGMYGNEMNLASKLGEDTGEHGQTLLTDAAYRNLSQPSAVRAQKREAHTSGIELTYWAVRPK